MTKHGRPKGTGYRSQGLICRALTGGDKSFQELVDYTGLHRNTVAANLKVLLKMNIVGKRREGRKSVYYSIDEGAEAYASLVLSPNWQKELKEAKKEFQRDKRIEAAITLAWIKSARKYKKEIEEMQSMGYNFKNQNISEIISTAKRWRQTKQERRAISSSLKLPSDQIPRIKVKRIVIEDLLEFARTHPEIVEDCPE